jgi:hypothetical protein
VVGFLVRVLPSMWQAGIGQIRVLIRAAPGVWKEGGNGGSFWVRVKSVFTAAQLPQLYIVASACPVV